VPESHPKAAAAELELMLHDCLRNWRFRFRFRSWPLGRVLQFWGCPLDRAFPVLSAFPFPFPFPDAVLVDRLN
jgi:hypothetical protein